MENPFKEILLSLDKIKEDNRKIMGLIKDLNLLDHIPPQEMNIKEAADYLRVSESWMYKHKEVPHTQLSNGRLVYFKSELDDYKQSVSLKRL